MKTIFDCDPTNALKLGTAIHTGIEIDAQTAIREYLSEYPIITDELINETIKIEYLIPKVKEILPEGIYEKQILTSDYIGYLDLLVRNDDNTYDIYDFKYSNHTDRYLESRQLHVYKYYTQKATGKIIRNLYYVMVPKIQIRQKKTETIGQFRTRLLSELQKSEIKLLPVAYRPEKVIEHLEQVQRLLEAEAYPKNETKLCEWCEYKQYCKEGDDYMILPNNERRQIDKTTKKVLWIYGAPFAGKTTFANDFPNPLMLNSDGNIRFVDAPYISIRDVVTVEGRLTKRTYAWEIFKDAIAELEKKENDFKTIVVDVLEEMYEHCRLYMYNKLGITHESDDSFKAWDMIRSEFLNTLKRLMNLDYENIILISHEDTSKDITRRGGDKVTRIAPNIQEKMANKIAGMVDLVARAVATDDDRCLEFKPSDVVFGGGRLKFRDGRIPLEYNAVVKLYEDITIPTPETISPTTEPTDAVTEAVESITEISSEPTTKRRRKTS